MKNVSAKLCKSLFVGLLLLLTGTYTAHAQSPGSSSSSIVSFVQSIAQAVYKAAWPTATYRTFTIDSVRPVASGLDIGVKLSGLSHWDGSDLWVILVIEVRNGSYHGVRVKDSNGVIPPFFTTGTAAQAAAEMANAYAAQHAQAPAPPVVTPAPAAPPAPAVPPAPAAPRAVTVPWAAAVCLANATRASIAFEYQWGGGVWQQAQIPSGEQLALWWPYGDGPRTSPRLSIRYDDSYAEGLTERDYDLDRNQASLPVSCDSAKNYHFALDGSTILVYATAAR